MRAVFGLFMAILMNLSFGLNNSYGGGYYYGPMVGKGAEPGNFVVVQGDDPSWFARSLMGKDLKNIEEMVKAYGQSSDPELQDAVVYLYDTTQDKSPLDGVRYNFKEDQARIRLDEKSETRPGPYQWLWFEAKDQSGLILIDRMPRAVSKLPRQKRILDFYKKLGAVSYDEKNEEIDYLGRYRRVENQAIMEIRIIPLITLPKTLSKLPKDMGSKPLDKIVFTDILKTATQFIRTMSQDHVAPVGYFTEKDKDRPASLLSYTAPSQQKEIYLSAGFTEETAKEFHDYFPYDVPRSPEERAVYFRKLSEVPKLNFDKSLAPFLLK